MGWSLKFLELLEKAKKLHLAFLCLFVALLTACTTSSEPKPEDRVAFWPVDKPNGCTIRLFQEGREIIPVVNSRTRHFELSPKKFRIEVTPIECKPTIARLHSSHLEYVLRTPLVFSSSGVFMAGDAENADILTGLGIEGADPNVSLSELASSYNDSVWVKQQHDGLCDNLGYCPTPIMAFSTAWPFLDPMSKKHRNYAEFNRLSKFKAMSFASGGTFQMVVYLNWNMLIKKGFWGSESNIYVLNPNVIVLKFK